VNIWKHSARLSLQVINGLKVISPLFCLASSFLYFHDLVRDIPSGSSCFVGLCLGGMRFSLVRALSAYLCGLLHPISLSIVHLWHVQFYFFWWARCQAGCQSCADVLIRSATLETLCFWRRHFALRLLMGFCLADRWYHTGSCAKR
jgi:hypothetical protein